MPQQFEFPKTQFPSLKLNPKTVYGVLGVLAGLWILSGIYTVAADEEAVVLRFGKLTFPIVGPGLSYHWPGPIERVYIRSVTNVYREEIGFRTTSPGRSAQRPHESLMLTGDENIIDVQMVVQYRVDDLVKALFNVKTLGVFQERTEGLVHDASEAALRQVVGRHGIDETLTEGKETVQAEIKDKLQELLNRYDAGLIIDEVKLQRVRPPAQVEAAFKDVASAKEDRERLENEAHGYQNDLIPKARGGAKKMLRGADAYKIERITRAQGDADRFRAVYREYQKAPDVTETRIYVETMEKILPGMQKYIIKSDATGGGGLINLLNLNQPQRPQATGTDQE